MRYFIFSLVVSVSCMVGLTGCGKKETVAAKPNPNQIVAVVDTQTLTWQEMDERASGYLKHAMEREHLAFASNKIAEVEHHFRQRAIKAFIYKTLMVQEAKRLKLTISEADRAQGLKDLEKNLKDKNWTTNDFFNKGPQPAAKMRLEFEDGLLIDKLLRSTIRNKISADEKEINQLIAQVTATNGLRRATIETVLKKIKDGEAFEELAKKFSMHPSAMNGGVLGDLIVGKNTLDKEVELAAIQQKVGAVSPVIETRSGFYLVKVISQTPGKPKTATTPEVPDKFNVAIIKVNRIPINRLQMSNTILKSKYDAAHQQYINELKKRAIISCPLYPDMKF